MTNAKEKKLSICYLVITTCLWLILYFRIEDNAINGSHFICVIDDIIFNIADRKRLKKYHKTSWNKICKWKNGMERQLIFIAVKFCYCKENWTMPYSKSAGMYLSTASVICTIIKNLFLKFFIVIVAQQKLTVCDPML